MRPRALTAFCNSPIELAVHQAKRTGKNEFLQNVHHINSLLAENPNLGPVEPLLADRAMMYRSVVANRLNKIVYFIKDDHIEVADFWDTRREPNAQAAQVK